MRRRNEIEDLVVPWIDLVRVLEGVGVGVYGNEG